MSTHHIPVYLLIYFEATASTTYLVNLHHSLIHSPPASPQFRPFAQRQPVTNLATRLKNWNCAKLPSHLHVGITVQSTHTKNSWISDQRRVSYMCRKYKVVLQPHETIKFSSHNKIHHQHLLTAYLAQHLIFVPADLFLNAFNEVQPTFPWLLSVRHGMWHKLVYLHLDF